MKGTRPLAGLQQAACGHQQDGGGFERIDRHRQSVVLRKGVGFSKELPRLQPRQDDPLAGRVLPAHLHPAGQYAAQRRGLLPRPEHRRCFRRALHTGGQALQGLHQLLLLQPREQGHPAQHRQILAHVFPSIRCRCNIQLDLSIVYSPYKSKEESP